MSRKEALFVLAEELGAKITLKKATARLVDLDVFESDDNSSGDESEDDDARLACLQAVLHNAKLAKLHPQAIAAMLALDMPEADRALLASPATLRGMDAFIAWSRSRATADDGNREEAPRAMVMLFADDLSRCRDQLKQSKRRRGARGMLAELAAKDAVLARSVDAIPRDLLAPLVRAMPVVASSGPAMPVFNTSLIAALIAHARNAKDAVAALVAIADDRELERCWPSAFAALADVDPRAVLARAERARDGSVHKAYTSVAHISARDAFDLMTPWLENRKPDDYQPWDLVANAVPSALREEPRWVDRARAFGGRSVLRAIARDQGNAQSDRAVQYFIDRVKASTDAIDRRWALESLGDTRHPNAVPTLLAAFHDPTIGSAMALTLEAISKCAGGDVIPILETRLDGPWKKYIQKAVDVIRAQKSGLSREQVIRACHDTDPVIAGLAQQARDGDDAARVVLEDALRERGLSSFESG